MWTLPFLTETWLGSNRTPVIKELCGSDHAFMGVHQPGRKRGGGVGIAHHKNISVTRLPMNTFMACECMLVRMVRLMACECMLVRIDSFMACDCMLVRMDCFGACDCMLVRMDSFRACECLLVRMDSFRACECLLVRIGLLIILFICRLPKASMLCFLEEFDELLIQTSMLSAQLLVARDFNIPVKDLEANGVSSLGDIMVSADLVQHVDKPTHTAGGVLDLLMSQPTDSPVDSISVMDTAISDHHGVMCTLSVDATRQLRPTNRSYATRRDFREVMASVLSVSLDQHLSHVDILECDPELLHYYSGAVVAGLDETVPVVKVKTKRRPPGPWITDDIRTMHQLRCRNECIWWRTNQHVPRQIHVEHRNTVTQAIQEAKEKYYTEELSGAIRGTHSRWWVAWWKWTGVTFLMLLWMENCVNNSQPTSATMCPRWGLGLILCFLLGQPASRQIVL